MSLHSTTVGPETPQAAEWRVGQLLRHFRQHRAVSQLELALRAGISQRHLSYVETGRASPSRDLVLRLAEVLELTFRQRNETLLAAGFAPIYSELPLDAPPVQAVRRTIELILAKQEPYPAVVLDRFWNMQVANAAFHRMLGALGVTFQADQEPFNIALAVFDPECLRPRIANWEVTADCLLGRLRQQLDGRCYEPRARTLLHRLETFAGKDFCPGPINSRTPLLPVVFTHGAFEVSLLITLTTISTTRDVTLQELLIQSYFPADDRSDIALKALV